MIVKAISLDIWGTLLRSDPAFKRARNEMLRTALVPEVDADEFDRVKRECDREGDEISMRRGTDVGFAERVELTLAALDSAHRGSPGFEARFARTSTSELMASQAELARQHPPRPLDDRLPDLVAELAETRPVVLTSNTGMLPGVLMRELLALAGFHGKLGAVFSNEVGWAKPDRRIFEAALALVEETAGEPIASADVVHVGDNVVADRQGAWDVGMSAVLVLPDGRSTVAALEELRRG